MATARPPAGPGPALGDFLDRLQSRLDALHPSELLAALVAHAERLPVAGREDFLKIFGESAGSPPGTPDRPDQLLGDIDDFARQLATGEYRLSEDDDDFYDGYSRGGHWHADDERWAPARPAPGSNR